jgi:hypothetical protein
MDPIVDIDRRLNNLEHKVAALFVKPKSIAPAPAPAPVATPNSAAKTPEEKVIGLIEARMKLHGARVDLDHALTQIRSHNYDDALIQIFTKGVPQTRR